MALAGFVLLPPWLTAECCICGFDVTTHPDDSQGGLAYCGDCGGATCARHRDDSQAQRCHRCAGKLMTLSRAVAVAKAMSRDPLYSEGAAVILAGNDDLVREYRGGELYARQVENEKRFNAHKRGERVLAFYVRAS